MGTVIKLPTRRCLHCGHEWVLRVLAPKECPRCRSRNYLRRKWPRRGRPSKIQIRRRLRA